ncbi:hypothetical protein V8E53_002248 [Lactarius tabidus]
MSLIEESIALTPHKITAQPPPNNEDAWLLEVAGIQLLYEATLQDLLCTKNYCLSSSLGTQCTSPGEMLIGSPSEVLQWTTPRCIARHHTKGPHWGAQYPSNCCQLSKGTQTEDASANTNTNVMLMDINPATVYGDLKEEAKK